MNTIYIRPAHATASESATSPRRTLTVVVIVVGILALFIRLALHTRAFDLYGDEVIYADLGRSVRSGGFPEFFGQIFFLHGPGFFFLEAGWGRLLGNPSGLMAWIYEMRELNALLASATAIVITLLVTKVSTVRAGAAAGLMFALDPFCIRQNDRVLLETSMMLWVLLGYLVFSPLVSQSRVRGSQIRAFGAGVLFGCAVLTKDEAALLTVVPLVATGVTRSGPRRTLIMLTISVTVLTYFIYVAVVAVNGYFSILWEAKTTGIQRLLGVIQVTGFHSHHGGSLSARLIAEGGYFVTTYVVLVLAVPALIVVIRRGNHTQRMLAFVQCAAAVTLAYAVTLGTLEEQELYLLVVPAIVTIPVAITLLSRVAKIHRRSAQRRHRTLVWMAAGALTCMLGLNLVTCLDWLRNPDDGFTLMLAYMERHVPSGTAVDIAAGTPPPSQTDGGRYALQNRYRAELWTTPIALNQQHVGYIMVEWGPIQEGYAYLSSSQVGKLIHQSHGRLVFSFSGRSYGQLSLYKVPSAHKSP